ncbi:MAG: hypothetical protein IJY90_00610 [Clostridia bacterium]|nr:hypothetical protein [Clostridia bacterium]
MKTCAFIGHRQMENVEGVKTALEVLLEGLIVDENVTRFLLGSGSQFNGVCTDVLLKIKQKHPHIKRVYVRVEYHLEDNQSFVGELYDESYFPNCAVGAGRKAYVLRNQHMIDASDVVVFYYNPSYLPQGRMGKNCRRVSGTQIAYNYVLKKRKRFVNVFK